MWTVCTANNIGVERAQGDGISRCGSRPLSPLFDRGKTGMFFWVEMSCFVWLLLLLNGFVSGGKLFVYWQLICVAG